MNPKKVINDAQRILKTAADVLEEEIAAGILAAKKVEKRVFNGEETRNTNSAELMSRIRRDTHEAIDIILDAVTSITNHLGNLTESLTKMNNNHNGAHKERSTPTIKNEEQARPGSSIEIPVLFSNDSKDKQMPVLLNISEIVSPQGNKIASRNVVLAPSSFTLAASGDQEVKVKIKIPKSCKAGTYSGLLQDKNDKNLRAVLIIDVE